MHTKRKGTYAGEKNIFGPELHVRWLAVAVVARVHGSLGDGMSLLHDMSVPRHPCLWV